MAKTVRSLSFSLFPLVVVNHLTMVWGTPMHNNQASYDGSYSRASLSPPRELKLFPEQPTIHWNPPVDAGSIYGGLDLGKQPEYPYDHLNVASWDQGQHNAHHYHHHLQPYGLNNFNNNNEHLQDMHLEQGSSSFQAPQEPYPNEIVQSHEQLPSYFDRQYCPQVEIDARPSRLNQFEWQKRYNEDELRKIYHRISIKWNAMPRSTMFDCNRKLNEHLQVHPHDIDSILNGEGDPFVIHQVVFTSKPNFSQNRASSVLLDSNDYLDWLFRPRGPVYPQVHKAPGSAENKQKKLLKRLGEQWGMDEERVMHRLSHLTDKEMETYSVLLTGRKSAYVQMAARDLDDIISQREAVASHQNPHNVAGPSGENHEVENGNDPRTWQFWPQD